MLAGKGISEVVVAFIKERQSTIAVAPARSSAFSAPSSRQTRYHSHMKPSVCIETSVISYLTARPSRDVIVLAHQEVTRGWWEQRSRYRLFVSRLVDASALPPQALEDAIHVAVCAVHRIDYLVSWNCKHIANAMRFGDIARCCTAAGFTTPVICTPDLMLANEDGEHHVE